ncbi:MAG: imidazole glycerol phosphate synthase subunit HisF [Phycisphaerales bacterium]|nr:imidazole glycerol phosphate synthase subunit HisF [Phycisphaerales bacterium]
MLIPRIIPCLDVRDGRIVKGVQFANLRDAGDPASRAAIYQDHGADEIVLLDVSATLEGRQAALRTIAAVREALSLPLTVGGGVRTADDAAAMLDAGADKVAVNTAAVNEPALLTRLADRFGCQCIVLALDAALRPTQSSWEVVTRSGKHRTGLDAITWATQAVALGAGEILLTSIDRDGVGSGYDIDLLRAISTAASVPVIASGGASGPDDLVAAIRAGVDAVLAASIFHDGLWTVDSVKRQLAASGIPTRQ